MKSKKQKEEKDKTLCYSLQWSYKGLFASKLVKVFGVYEERKALSVVFCEDNTGRREVVARTFTLETSPSPEPSFIAGDFISWLRLPSSESMFSCSLSLSRHCLSHTLSAILSLSFHSFALVLSFSVKWGDGNT